MQFKSFTNTMSTEALDREVRSDYKLDKAGRKSHKQITFHDGISTDDKEKEKPEMKEEMSDAQKAERERLVKGMKKSMAGFKAKYGERAKEVMYATATKKAMQEAKDEKEYGYEGDMALNQLATLTRCAEMIKDILKPDTDMPEWVQSKITLATDYIQTAADYMYSEMNEELKGKQHKLDKNKNGKLDAHDFKLLRKEENECDDIEEQAPVAPSLMKHRISVTVSDPDHTMVSKRKEKMQKTVVVTHSDNKEGAQKVGEKFYKKKGYIVHDSSHAGMVKEDTSLDEQGMAKGSESSIQKKIQSKQDSLSLAREQRRAKGQRQQGQREIKLQSEIDRLNTELTQLKKQGLAEEETQIEDFDQEGNLMAEKLKFSDFIAKMNEHLLEYETGAGGVYRHTKKATYGTSYQGDDDEDNKPKKPEPTGEKRGRGRPAGSKSGANQKVSSGKSYGGIAIHSLNLPK